MARPLRSFHALNWAHRFCDRYSDKTAQRRAISGVFWENVSGVHTIWATDTYRLWMARRGHPQRADEGTGPYAFPRSQTIWWLPREALARAFRYKADREKPKLRIMATTGGGFILERRTAGPDGRQIGLGMDGELRMPDYEAVLAKAGELLWRGQVEAAVLRDAFKRVGPMGRSGGECQRVELRGTGNELRVVATGDPYAEHLECSGKAEMKIVLDGTAGRSSPFAKATGDMGDRPLHNGDENGDPRPSGGTGRPLHQDDGLARVSMNARLTMPLLKLAQAEGHEVELKIMPMMMQMEGVANSMAWTYLQMGLVSGNGAYRGDGENAEGAESAENGEGSVEGPVA